MSSSAIKGYDKNDKKVSKLCSAILRHKPADFGIVLDAEGWASVDDILRVINGRKPFSTSDLSYDAKDLYGMAERNDKQRFSISADFTKIRANQGHSIKVDLKLEPVENPPPFLFHGTARKNISSIMKDGLLKSGRQYVHLSYGSDTALNVGSRHERNGTPAMFVVDTKVAMDGGQKFYISDNKVWLADHIPAECLTLVN
jgi:putative RNA 2'-phosphotransferase